MLYESLDIQAGEIRESPALPKPPLHSRSRARSLGFLPSSVNTTGKLRRKLSKLNLQTVDDCQIFTICENGPTGDTGKGCNDPGERDGVRSAAEEGVIVDAKPKSAKRRSRTVSSSKVAVSSHYCPVNHSQVSVPLCFIFTFNMKTI